MARVDFSLGAPGAVWYVNRQVLDSMRLLSNCVFVVFLGSAIVASPVRGSEGACSNGVVETGEACDDGNRRAGDCCSPGCQVEESYLGCAGDCLCDTCDDGVDNDQDGLRDAEDPECATLSRLQRFALIEGERFTTRSSEAPIEVRSVRNPNALAGAAVDGVCDAATGACVCAGDDDCQAAGAPCVADEECEAAAYPAGESRAWICDRQAVADDEECRMAGDSVAREIEHLSSVPATRLFALGDFQGGSLHLGAGTHVLDVDRFILGPDAEWLFQGEDRTRVVVRVRRALDVARGARVRLGGEMEADRLLWVLVGESGMRLGDDAGFAGTVLAAADATVELGHGWRWEGALIGARHEMVRDSAHLRKRGSTRAESVW